MKDTGFFAEFKKFITRGNVLDMAVGVVIGASFNAIVNSLVNDIISPVIGVLTGGIDFSAMVITLRGASEMSEAVTINIGLFVNAVIQFLLVALCLFIVVRSFNKLHERRKKSEEAEKSASAEPAKPADIVLLEEIRDLLKRDKAE